MLLLSCERGVITWILQPIIPMETLEEFITGPLRFPTVANHIPVSTSTPIRRRCLIYLMRYYRVNQICSC